MNVEKRLKLLCAMSWTMLVSCTTAQITPQDEIATTEFGPQQETAQSEAPMGAPSSPLMVTNEKRAGPREEVFGGTGSLLNTDAMSADRKGEVGPDGVTLNFVDASVPEVARAVLGNILKVNYAIDPQVKGRITLQSSRPIERGQVMSALQNALALSGIALVESEDGTINILTLAAAKGSGAGLHVRVRNRPLPTGFGTLIVPLRFVSASEMEKVLRPLVPDGAIVSVDDARNLILLSGMPGELEAATEAIDLFDVNWLQGMSFALFTPEHAGVEDLGEELSLIFNNANNPMAGLVELIPIPRINGLLVMTPEPDLLREVRTWIKRLDKSGSGPAPQIFVYYVQHGNAEEITSSLTSILAGAGGQNGGASPRSPVEEGGSPTSARPSGGSVKIGGSGEIKIVANNKNNAIMIYGTANEYEMIRAAIEQLDIPVDQVLIEATIAEVKLNDELKYGVEWFFASGDFSATQASNTAGAVTSQFPGLSLTYFQTSTEVALNALESVTDVQVLSSPKLVVLNNQTATLQVGDQVPVATQSAVSINDTSAPIVNAVQFRDTGVILEVTPRINKNGIVLLEVNQEVSNVVSTTSSGIDSPTIQQRKVSSTVTIADGQTIALGGLIEDTQSQGKSGMPGVSRIPVVGTLFGSQSSTARRTELLIFITPHIIHNMSEANEVTEYLRDQLTRSDFFKDVK